MPTRKFKKFKIGDVVRIKGDRKLARIAKLNPEGLYQGHVKLDRPIKGRTVWDVERLVHVLRRPVSGQKKKKR